MSFSRLAIATVVSLRAVLVYGEASAGTADELTWRDVLPLARPRPRTGLAAAPQLSSPPARV